MQHSAPHSHTLTHTNRVAGCSLDPCTRARIPHSHTRTPHSHTHTRTPHTHTRALFQVLCEPDLLCDFPEHRHADLTPTHAHITRTHAHCFRLSVSLIYFALSLNASTHTSLPHTRISLPHTHTHTHAHCFRFSVSLIYFALSVNTGTHTSLPHTHTSHTHTHTCRFSVSLIYFALSLNAGTHTSLPHTRTSLHTRTPHSHTRTLFQVLCESDLLRAVPERGHALGGRLPQHAPARSRRVPRHVPHLRDPPHRHHRSESGTGCVFPVEDEDTFSCETAINMNDILLSSFTILQTWPKGNIMVNNVNKTQSCSCTVSPEEKVSSYSYTTPKQCFVRALRSCCTLRSRTCCTD